MELAESFMSVNRKHFYRFVYLKSDHWKNLRLEKLVSVQGKCHVCKMQGFDFDVHHISYRNLYDVRLDDLAVLCRKCHKHVHEVLDNLHMPDDQRVEKWKICRYRISRLFGSDLVRWRQWLGATKEQRMSRFRVRFKCARAALVRMGVLYSRSQMEFDERLYGEWVKSTQYMIPSLWYDAYLRLHPEFEVWPCGEH